MDDLREQIKAISDLHTQLQSIRHIPAALLRRPLAVSNDPFGGSSSYSLKADFERLSNLGDTLRSEVVQKALQGAQDRLQADDTQLDGNYRRENRKRRWGVFALHQQ